MIGGLRARVACLSLVGLCAPVFAQSVTYEFTGSVTSATGAYSTIANGSAVSGTYTFDFAAATPGQGGGVIGSPSAWSVVSRSGSSFGSPPAAAVFSSTAAVDGFTYNSSTPGTFLNLASVRGGTVFGAGTFSASEEVLFPDGVGVSSASSMNLLAVPGPPYLSSGLPILATPSAPPDSGSFQEALAGSPSNTGYSTVVYEIATLTRVSAVPEPTTWEALVMGCLIAIGLRAYTTRQLPARSPR